MRPSRSERRSRARLERGVDHAVSTAALDRLWHHLVMREGERLLSATLVFELALQTVNELNAGSPTASPKAYYARTARRKKQRQCANLNVRGALARAGVRPHELVPCVVTLTRLSAGRMDDDGLAASMKSIRDGIADALGINDGGSLVRWLYDQAKVPPKTFGVRVTISRSAT